MAFVRPCRILFKYIAEHINGLLDMASFDFPRPFQIDNLVDIHAHVAVHHEVQLPVDNQRACNQYNGSHKLDHHQSLTEKNTPGTMF